MQRIALGLAAGLAAWFGSVAVVEAAQQSPIIEPIGPGLTSIQAGQRTVTYSANISVSSALVATSMKVKIYRVNPNESLTLVYNTMFPNVQAAGSTSFSYIRSCTFFTSYTPAEGDKLRFECQAWQVISGITYASPWVVTQYVHSGPVTLPYLYVQPGGQTYHSAPETRPEFTSEPRDRDRRIYA